jgi:hypothetical protein
VWRTPSRDRSTSCPPSAARPPVACAVADARQPAQHHTCAALPN